MVISFFRNLFRHRERLAAEPISLQVMPVNSARIRELVEAERESQSWNSSETLEAMLRYYSGYFRQAAVERSLELRLPGTLPLVASRLNDWVPQVCQAARSAVLSMLDDASLDDQRATLQIVGHLQKAGRTNHANWILEFEIKFISVVGEEVVWNWFVNGPPKLARTCFDILLRRSPRLFERLLAQAVTSNGDIILAIRSVELASNLPGSEGLSVLKGAMESHFGAVRRVALRFLLARGEADELVLNHLLDLHGTVRSLAMSRLREQQFDLKSYYRNALCSQSRPAVHRIALLSLAALDSSEDLALVKEFTNAGTSGVRATAYSAWLRLAPTEKDELMLRAFSDKSPLVRKFARLVLERHGAYASFAGLYRSIGPDEYLFNLMFMVHSHKWNWLEAIVMIAHDVSPGSPMAAGLAVELRSWISNARWSRLRPIGAQAQSLSAPATIQVLERLIEGESNAIEQMREYISEGTAA